MVFILTTNVASSDFYQRLYELENVFEGELDFAHLAKNILNTVTRETAATAGIIYWFDEVQNELKIKTISGVPTVNINKITKTLRQPQGILERMTKDPTPFLLTKLEKGVAMGLSELSGLADYQSLLVVPLTIQSKLLGLLILFQDKGVFNQSQLEILTAFAPRVAVHLDNARLYQLTKETALENAQLYVNISKLYQHATTDHLTGLYNRSFLMQRIREEIKKARRFKQPLAILFADLDHFKSVNDEHGHQVGDQLLTEFGNFIKKSVREYDIACRFGGEEFVILLPQTTLENALKLAERLRISAAKKLFCQNIGLQVTVSFGVNALTEMADAVIILGDEQLLYEIENLIAGADEALYRAKNAGRNQAMVHQYNA